MQFLFGFLTSISSTAYYLVAYEEMGSVERGWGAAIWALSLLLTAKYGS